MAADVSEIIGAKMSLIGLSRSKGMISGSLAAGLTPDTQRDLHGFRKAGT